MTTLNKVRALYVYWFVLSTRNQRVVGTNPTLSALDAEMIIFRFYIAFCQYRILLKVLRIITLALAPAATLCWRISRKNPTIYPWKAAWGLMRVENVSTP